MDGPAETPGVLDVDALLCRLPSGCKSMLWLDQVRRHLAAGGGISWTNTEGPLSEAAQKMLEDLK